MFVEGLMTKGWVLLLAQWGHKFDCIVENEEEAEKAREEGLDVPDLVDEDMPWVRLWVDADTESLFPLRPMIEDIHKNNPRLMAKLATNPDPEIVKVVEEFLKGK